MILVDTSAWITFFHGRGPGADLVDALLNDNQVAICDPILTEIYRGLPSDSERKKVIALFGGCRFLEQPTKLWEEAGVLGFLLRKKKKSTKTIDLLIACYALAHRVPLFTLDSNFKRIQEAGFNLELWNSSPAARFTKSCG